MIETFYKVPKVYEAQVQKLTNAVFPITDKNRDEEIEEFYTLDRDKFGRVVYITKDNKVVGKISLYKRIIPFRDATITLGGIGGVCTDPKYRKMGIASSLLPHAIKTLYKETCDVAFLCTDITSPWKVKMYNDIGFELLPHGYNFSGKSNKTIVRTDGFLLSLHSKLIWKKIMTSPDPLFIGQGRW